jgi:type IV pilus assembly protein PilC
VEFRCRFASASGQVSEGVYVADSEGHVRRELEDKGLLVLSVRPKGALRGAMLRLPRRRGVAPADFLMFNQELATLLKAGMPLVQSLDLLKRRVDSPLFRAVLDDIHDRVRAGAALSDAFAFHGDLFPRVYTASLVAGERSGSLEVVLRRYVEYAKIVSTVKRKTISALVYPAILVCLAVLLVSIIVLRVVPAFSEFYAAFNARELPLSTRIIMALSEFLRRDFMFIAIAVAGAAVAFAIWIRQPGQRARFDHLLLGVPVVGAIARKFATSQMSRTLATLLGGGLPLVNSLDIAARSVGNQHIAEALSGVSSRVREGVSLAAALDATKAFPDVVVKMAEVGESTGALQEMLNTVADFYDEEIATNMERFVTLIEPALLVIMGVVIAGLLLALYMPLFQLSSVLG